MKKEEQGKKKSKLWIILIVVAVLLMLIIAIGMSGDEEDYVAEEYVTDTTDGEETSDEETYSDDIDFTSEADYPMGTCKELEGTTVIMSIAANDASTSWNTESEEDMNTLSDISRKFAIGLDWITEQGKAYGKDINFIYDWDEDSDLFCMAELSAEYDNSDSNLQDQKTFIDDNLSEHAKKLVKKYNADNIMFVYYFNKPEDTEFVCFATPFQGTERGMDLPYETVCVDKWVYGAEQGPATYAHEVLHLFGAPDLYNVDVDGSNYGMTQEFVDYCQENHLNEIMNATYDPYNNVIPQDKVTNDLSDLTAYYIGWIDSNEECENYGVANSAH